MTNPQIIIKGDKGELLTITRLEIVPIEFPKQGLIVPVISADAKGRLISTLKIHTGKRPDGGAMKVIAEVDAHGFSAKYDDIWLWPTLYENFIDQLVVVEREKVSKATLTSSSPEELIVTIRYVHRAGHWILEGQIGRYVYIQDDAAVFKCNFAFSPIIDLAQLLADFKLFAK